MTEPVRHEVRARIDQGTSRGAERIALVGAFLILIALIKPWGQPAASPVPPALGPDRTVPITVPTAAAPAAEPQCIGLRWLIEADERWAGQIVRTWAHTDAVEATGPDDPTIPFVVVAAEQVMALGYCPPRGEAHPGSTLTIYRLSPTPEVVPAKVVPTVSFRMAQIHGAAANVLLRPAFGRSSPMASGVVSWPAGRYVFRVEAPDGSLYWLGVDLRLISLEHLW